MRSAAARPAFIAEGRLSLHALLVCLPRLRRVQLAGSRLALAQDPYLRERYNIEHREPCCLLM